MKELRFQCRKVSPGSACSPAVCSEEEILFYHADQKSGIITESGHAAEGKSVAGRIVVFPGGKGSSVVQADGLYHLEQNGTAPKGLIVQYLDTVLVATAVIMEIPMVWKVSADFWKTVKDGDLINIDADNETVTILKGDE